MNPRLPFLACLLFSPLPAAVTLAPVFSDGAVLQREKPVPIWGSADPGERVSVSFAGQTLATTAGPDGRWRIDLAPLSASATGRDLVVQGADTHTIRDVVVGEVWLASGQSNMRWPLAYSTDAKAEIRAADFPLLRQFKVGEQSARDPSPRAEGAWIKAVPETAGRFSGVAYYFGLSLHQELGVPVGILNSAVGGTAIAAWIAPDAYRATPELAPAYAKFDQTPRPTPEELAAYRTLRTEWEKARTDAKAARTPFKTPAPKAPRGIAGNRTPGGLYNGMIAPLVPGALRGVIWYQGEADASHAGRYPVRFAALISGWREQFAQGDLPFYWVQLPNFDHAGKNDTSWHWAELREAQTQTLAVANTGQAVTIDVGEAKNLHPKNKKPVGQRLARLALARTYGHADVIDTGPVFKTATREGDAYRVTFEPSPSPLQSAEAGLTGFELAGEDKVFHPAEARIEGSAVIVRSASVASPAALRYAYRNAPDAGLFNQAGLPAVPFRTDTW